MKYIKSIIALLLLLPSITHAAIQAPWNASSTDPGFIQPTAINGTIPMIRVPSITSTSTTATSTFAGPVKLGPYTLCGDAVPLYTDSTVKFECWGDNNGAVQIGVGNRNSGTSAYNGIFFNNDSTDSTVTHFGFLGQNSSKYNDTTYGTGIAAPNQILLQGTDGLLTLDSSTSTPGLAGIDFLIGGSNLTNRIGIFTTVGLGLGTSTPYAKLSVVGEAVATNFSATSTTATSTFAGGTIFPNNTIVQSVTGRIGIGTASPTNALQLVRSNDITSGTFTGLINGANTFTNTAALANSNNNGYVFANTYNLTNAPGGRTITGSMFNANFASTGTTSTSLQLVGLNSQLLNAGSYALGVNIASTTGYLTSVGNSNANASNSFTYSFRSVPFFSGTGTNVFGFYAQDFGGAGTVTNQYGLYIDPLVKATNNYGIYAAGTSTNYFGGNVGIGTSTPASKLQVFNTSTSTISIDSNSATQGSCLEMKDSDGVGYTYVTANNGVLSASTVSCK